MAQLCRDLFTPIAGVTTRLVGHLGESVTWQDIDDLNDAGIVPADLFLTPAGTVYHGGYSTATSSVSAQPAFQVSVLSYAGTNIAIEWQIINLGPYLYPEGDGGVSIGGGGVRPYDPDGVEASGTVGADPGDPDSQEWAGASLDGRTDNGAYSSSIQLWFSMNDTAYSGFYVQHDGATLSLYRSDDGGTQTLLGSASHTLTVGVSYTIKLTRHSNSLRVYVDGASMFAVTDSHYTGSNKIGVRINGGSSQVRGIHLDSLLMYTESSDPPAIGTPVLTGTCTDAETAALSWTSATNADSYELYRQNPNLSWRLLYSGTNLSYTDTARAIGFWKYKVRGVATAGNTGPYSNTVTVYVETQYFAGPDVDEVGDTPDQMRVVIKAWPPESLEDGFGGRICPVSGMWFPASKLVNVDGVMVGVDYAHLAQKPLIQLPDTF